MGMDVSGKDPIIRTPEPKEIDWQNATKEEKKAHNELRQKWYDENPGVYFRANIWSWRPIWAIMAEVNRIHDLGIANNIMTGMQENSGYGLKNQEECNKLANAIESYVKSEFKDWDVIGLNTGIYQAVSVDKDGFISERFITDEKGKAISEKLGNAIFIQEGQIELDGVDYTTSHSVYVEHVTEWIKFLRECGGFRVF